jgi:hypothetical protein
MINPPFPLLMTSEAELFSLVFGLSSSGFSLYLEVLKRVSFIEVFLLVGSWVFYGPLGVWEFFVFFGI